MPPVRTISAPPKPPMKTERTHEENQERAYIAASRRSDRSLEARVESARRASEIHKRRTGRALRVTEQDVINEEMYEEEDEDLPMQYRRLTAHLNNSGGAGLNSRLAAYLTNHIAMRSALGQAIANSQQQFPNPSNFSSLQPQIWGQSPPQTNPTDSHRMMQQSPTSYRQSPYPLSPSQAPSSHPLNQQPTPNSATLASSAIHDTDSTQPTLLPPKPERRASEPVQLSGAAPPGVSGVAPGPSTKAASASPTGLNNATSNFSDDEDGQKTAGIHPQYPPPVNSPHHQRNLINDQPNYLGPLTTAMPRETQMYPGYGFDLNNPFGMNIMGDSGKNPQPGKTVVSNDFSKMSLFQSSFDGMNQTLAPSALDVNPCQDSWQDYSTTTEDSMGNAFSASPYLYNFDQAFNDPFMKQSAASDGGGQSGQMTPSGDGDWDSFIDQSSWD